MELKMDKILLILVVGALFIAAVQAIQMMSVKNSLESGSVSIGGAPTKTIATSSPSKTAIDIQADIPDQVGGCF